MIFKNIKLIFYIFSLCSVLSISSFAQDEDSTYIESYKQKFWITVFTSRNSIQIDKEYKPNTPLNLGIGFAIRNTVINVALQLPVLRQNEEKYGKTENTDVQIHNFGRYFVYDLFYQRYKGFYSDDRATRLSPDRLLRQIGFQGTYIFNGSKFSAKAAFQHRERQLKSAGSFILGGGLYHYKVKYTTETDLRQISFNNLLLGLNVGYAYSWVVSEKLLMTCAASAGITLGNEFNELKNGKIKIYPTTFVRGAIGYHESIWGVNLSFLLHNKSLYSPTNIKHELTAMNMKVAFILHIDRFY